MVATIITSSVMSRDTKSVIEGAMMGTKRVIGLVISATNRGMRRTMRATK